MRHPTPTPRPGATRSCLALIVAAAVCAAAAPRTVVAQEWRGSSRISGKVVDADGSPVPGAEVRLYWGSYDEGPVDTTDENGRWAVAGLARGRWHLRITAQGYAPAEGDVSVPRRGPFTAQLERAADPGPPPELVARLQEGDAAYAEGRYASAREAYLQALDLWLSIDPAAATAGAESLLALHKQIARCYREEGDLAKELEHLQVVLDADPSDAGLRALMAQEALQAGQVERAEELLGGEQDAAVDDPAVFFNIAVRYLNDGDAESALPYLTRALEVDPENALALYQRALAHFNLQRLDAAAADCARLLELAPEGEHAETARALLQAIEQMQESEAGQR